MKNSCRAFFNHTKSWHILPSKAWSATTGFLTNIGAGAGNAVQNLSYQYDKVGNVIVRTDGNQNLTESFAYKGFNEEGSQVLRAEHGEIYYVSRLQVTDPAAHHYEAFTLTDSNRAQLFVRSSFRDRVRKAKLQGITLKEIGELV